MDSPYNPPRSPYEEVAALVQALTNWGLRLDAGRAAVPTNLRAHYEFALAELGKTQQLFAALEDPLWRAEHPDAPDAPHAGSPAGG
jgi:hypothetical protein